MDEGFTGTLGGIIMTFADVLTSAGAIVTTSVSTAKDLVTELPFITLPAAFIFGRKLAGMAKGLLFAGGRRRR